MKGEKGFALVITLVVTALLVALLVEFTDDVFVETSSRQNFVNSQQASLMANSGIEGAIKLLQFSQLAHPSYTTLSDPWAKPLKIDDEKGALTVTIEDETGKLNLNMVVGENGMPNPFYHDAARRLLKRQGLPSDLLDALGDWIDRNDEPSPGGAEATYYLNLKQPYKPKNGKLQTVEELALVKGFNTDIIKKLSRFVTVYPPEALAAPININTAPREVLAVLAEDITDSLATRVDEYRVTTPFKFAADLLKVTGMETIGTALTSNTQAKGNIYRIKSKAVVRDTERNVEAVIQDGAFLYWREF